MRKPDREYQHDWKGMMVTVREWCEPTDVPYDGEFDLALGDEGWDIFVEVELVLYGESFKASDSLGSIWGSGELLRESIREDFENIRASALEHLKTELKEIGVHRRDVTKALKRASFASAAYGALL